MKAFWFLQVIFTAVSCRKFHEGFPAIFDCLRVLQDSNSHATACSPEKRIYIRSFVRLLSDSGAKPDAADNCLNRMRRLALVDTVRIYAHAMSFGSSV